jgi:glycosyltransferase involved in cell wall biosynthesis
MTKKICIICPHPEGVAPGQRLKYEQYLPHWNEEGYQVDIFPFQSMRFWDIAPKKGMIPEKIFWTIVGYCKRIWMAFRLRNYDITYIFLWVTPFGPPIFERIYRLLSKKIIFDIDDLVFLGNTSMANSWISKFKGKNKSIYLMKNADNIITTTPYLMDYCKLYSIHVVSIPPSIGSDVIRPMSRERNPILKIGWSGSHSTVKYLSIIESALYNLSLRYKFELIVFGVERFKIKGIQCRSIKWSPQLENTIFNEMDIALYPQEKEEWSEGKYGGKMIQYLAAGLPIVMSNSNALIPQIITNYKNGIIVENTSSEWEYALIQLIENKDLREKISLEARKLFLEKFSIEANRNKYLEVLNSTVQSRPEKSIL